MQLTADLFPHTAKVFTVGELTRQIRGMLETKFSAVWVQGEISNYKLHPSGHQYFTLKDQRAQIACVIWRDAMAPLRQPLADGAQVQVYGTVTVFEAQGKYQLRVEILQPRGVGLLQAKFEALKRKLEAEGLFDAARKRALPKFPRRIGIVTSPSGAAVRDVLNILKRRAPWLQILINPVRVQGVGAAQEIAVAVRELAMPNKNWSPVDVIVVTRGGGSIEDLWEFNEEIVARAIFNSAAPIVSAISWPICARRLRAQQRNSLCRTLPIFAGTWTTAHARSSANCSIASATDNSGSIMRARLCAAVSATGLTVTSAVFCTLRRRCTPAVPRANSPCAATVSSISNADCLRRRLVQSKTQSNVSSASKGSCASLAPTPRFTAVTALPEARKAT
jgi:hypothetical protein